MPFSLIILSNTDNLCDDSFDDVKHRICFVLSLFSKWTNTNGLCFCFARILYCYYKLKIYSTLILEGILYWYCIDAEKNTGLTRCKLANFLGFCVNVAEKSNFLTCQLVNFVPIHEDNVCHHFLWFDLKHALIQYF